uniref:Secreted protein n=1 Tax=Anguilla anguilla TaxID=7936 RepID=A0A0E9WIR6_ANGAN
MLKMHVFTLWTCHSLCVTMQRLAVIQCRPTYITWPKFSYFLLKHFFFCIAKQMASCYLHEHVSPG